MDNMQAHRAPEPDNYSSATSSVVWTYKLEPVKGGNFRPKNMAAEQF